MCVAPSEGYNLFLGGLNTTQIDVDNLEFALQQHTKVQIVDGKSSSSQKFCLPIIQTGSGDVDPFRIQYLGKQSLEDKLMLVPRMAAGNNPMHQTSFMAKQRHKLQTNRQGHPS